MRSRTASRWRCSSTSPTAATSDASTAISITTITASATAEVKGILDQLAASGTLFLTFSGGEPLLRKDFFELLEHARALGFDVKIKTNAILLGEHEAIRIRDLGVRQVQISIYSHRPEVHDAMTKVPGSLDDRWRPFAS